jgi:hypothetical protein
MAQPSLSLDREQQVVPEGAALVPTEELHLKRDGDGFGRDADRCWSGKPY